MLLRRSLLARLAPVAAVEAVAVAPSRLGMNCSRPGAQRPEVVVQSAVGETGELLQEESPQEELLRAAWPSWSAVLAGEDIGPVIAEAWAEEAAAELGVAAPAQRWEEEDSTCQLLAEGELVPGEKASAAAVAEEEVGSESASADTAMAEHWEMVIVEEEEDSSLHAQLASEAEEGRTASGSLGERSEVAHIGLAAVVEEELAEIPRGQLCYN